MAGSVVGTKLQHRSRGIVRLKAAFTTDAADGSVAATKIGAAFGRLVGVVYNAGSGGTALATGVDITITDEVTGATVFSLTNAGTSSRHIRPTGIVTTNAGVAITADTSNNDVNRDIVVAGGLKVTVAQGGNSKVGGIDLIVDERS